jgi:DNA-binding XRE family transcriptional regulator
MSIREQDMLSTGRQLRAGRVLAGLSQAELAKRAQVNVNTIISMEKKDLAELTSAFDVVRRVARALEESGVVFTNGDEPGVKLRKAR